MGASHSTKQLQPVREPAALMSTGAGVIVRISDTTGASTYEHNSRLSTAPTSILHPVGTDKQPNIAVVRPGERNQALKGSIVYLKKASRS
ncbi:hypothetical protein PHMEG_0003271 [Phytophthora megakarya]|uniref:Uncharacterized protein n=1 Tax=Phytophthora megakarya TaxID=4795 RepID=A0A225WZ26_9STRA|nr:hypothetical protein PHMEG_0003271 [Phytophthora megakarya]